MEIIKNLGYVVAGAVFLGLSGTADANLVTNGSFENGSYCGNTNFCTLGAGSTAISGWTISSGSVDWISSNFWPAADGLMSLDMTGSSAGGLTASTSFNTILGREYQLSFAMSGNPDGSPAVKQLAVGITPNGGISNSTGIFPGATIFSYDTAAQGNSRFGDMKWVTHSLNFTGLGVLTSLSFHSLTPGLYGPALDDVAVVEYFRPSASVPEPLTLALALMSFGAIGLRKLRRSVNP